MSTQLVTITCVLFITDQVHGRLIKLHLLIYFSLHCSVRYNEPKRFKTHTSNPFITCYLLKWKTVFQFRDFDILNIYLFIYIF